MPPSRVKIERIPTDRTRQNTFHKRKLGLIKKAIELTILCDCDCAVLLRNGPTEMNKEGTLLAYCNKDLVALLQDFMGQRPMNIYTNDDYNRFAKGAHAAGDEVEASVEFDDRPLGIQPLASGAVPEDSVSCSAQAGNNFSQGQDCWQGKDPEPHNSALKRGYDTALGGSSEPKQQYPGYQRPPSDRVPAPPSIQRRHGVGHSGTDGNSEYNTSSQSSQPPHHHPHHARPGGDQDEADRPNPGGPGRAPNRDISDLPPYSPHLQHQGSTGNAGLPELHQFNINHPFHHGLLDDTSLGGANAAGRGLNDLPLFGSSVSQDESDKHDYWTWSI